MDAGILQALKAVKSNPYVQYVGLGLAGLVTQKEQHDEKTGAPLRKTKLQLVRISAAVCGIELCYAAETAFVSPILLKLGVPPSLMTMIWCLSPMLGFFMVPIMGSLSDRCGFKLGRRRPFIIIMSIGIILGLALVPNGEILGIWLGDTGNETVNSYPGWNASSGVINETIYLASKTSMGISFSLPPGHLRGIIFTIVGVAMLDFNCDACQSPCRAYLLDICVPEDHSTGLTMFTVMAGLGGTVGYIMGGIDWNATSFGEALGGHIRVVFSIVLIAFIAFVISTLTSFREIPLSELNIKQNETQRSKKKVGKSKYRKFTNEDSSSEEDCTDGVERGANSTRYGAVSETNTNDVLSKRALELSSQDKADNGVAVSAKLNSEGPKQEPVASLNSLPNLNKVSHNPFTLTGPVVRKPAEKPYKLDKEPVLIAESRRVRDPPVHITNSSTVDPSNNDPVDSGSTKSSNSVECNGTVVSNTLLGDDEINPYSKPAVSNGDVTQVNEKIETVEVSTDVTLRTYLRSIVQMPRSMWVLCLCNLLCWMSLVCYSLYFTDFVGQSVYGGDPTAPEGSDLHDKYDAGVRLGSFGMSLYSLSCACYSLGIERLVHRFRAKKVYVLGQLVFTVGMAGMALSRSKVAVILLSPAAGIMYATLFTMPYLLVAHYHTRGLFSHGEDMYGNRKQVRGLGTDVAIISSMVFLAQFVLSFIMGTVVTAVDSTTAVIIASAILSFLGSMTATQVTYLDL
ncbi:proton-associated sugar transporter A-like [Physella acuta]|uniref:proton-associated sugar transporter A-like n=1 Tax=Physella acuta TaxID=109671 RepID=UPI0027DB8A01|nr:proton-associated sugar transporter A-like [Physella acuta]